MKSLCVLGRLPALGIAELESLYGANNMRPIGNFAVVLDVDPPKIDFSRLGGTVKFAKVLAVLDTTNWKDIQSYLEEAILKHLGYLPEGKLRLGLSVYGLGVKPDQIRKTGLALKKVARAQGRSTRFIPNVELALNSAQVLHNNLTGPLGWEFIFVRDGDKTILAQNIAEQNIEAYAARDQKRPKRDSRVGMLPPKLAQTIINLAVGLIDWTEAKDTKNNLSLDAVQGRIEVRNESYAEVRRVNTGDSDTAMRQEEERVMSSAHEQAFRPEVILDPFCGTGVLLQEALLMGIDVYGSDLDPRMVEYSKVNLEWLSKQKFPACGDNLNFNFKVEAGDATTFKWDKGFDVLASETYLGRPFSSEPTDEVLAKVMRDVDTIHHKFLKNLASQTKPNFRLCLAVPAWLTKTGIKHLFILDQLTDMGYTRLSFAHASNKDLVYHREGQVVARELIVLQRT